MLYLDRPLLKAGEGAGLGGAVRIQRLEGSRFSGAAAYGSWIEFSWSDWLTAGCLGGWWAAREAVKSGSRNSAGELMGLLARPA